MKQAILIVMPGAMELGGVERSLLGLLSAIDYNLYDVDLFLYGHHGSLFQLIDPRVNLLPEVKELAYLRSSMKEKLRHGCYHSALLRLRDALASKFFPTDNDSTWAEVMRHHAYKLEKCYDLALSFFLPFDFLSEKVNAKLKVGWIHTDYSSEKANLNSLYQQYSKVDLIAAVSEQCRKSFCDVFPRLSDKVIVVENILPQAFIIHQANAFDPEAETPKKGIRLLSIGRYCTAKNFDNVPDICARLLQNGLDVYWYIIGFGPDEQLIREKIVQAHMEDRVILLGKKENPYPYIKACDLYVQPSRYEGKSVTVREAQMLGKPVVITQYPTSGSQLEDGVDGVIVPLDNEGCANGIAALLHDSEKMTQLSITCRQRDYSNASEIEKLYQLSE